MVTSKRTVLLLMSMLLTVFPRTQGDAFRTCLNTCEKARSDCYERCYAIDMCKMFCKKTTPHLLLLDGHASHKTLDVILYSREWRCHTNFPASLHPSTTTPGSNVLPILEGSIFTCGRQLDDLETSTDRSRSLTSSRSSMRRTKRRPP
ncbi:hypothetical protein LSAT2_008043 [Lamellibrachia satsuma]|nr:hypothetical protein LSAT2_008043 [Lamellibrachia satsuma]